MKKIATLFLVLAIMIGMVACGNDGESATTPVIINDTTHASVEITFPSGDVETALSSNKPDPSKTSYAWPKKYPDGVIAIFAVNDYPKPNSACILVPNPEDSVTVHFFCTECGHDETVEFVAPSSKRFSCDCPFTLDEYDGGGVRECFDISVDLNTETEESLETETTEEPCNCCTCDCNDHEE